MARSSNPKKTRDDSARDVVFSGCSVAGLFSCSSLIRRKVIHYSMDPLVVAVVAEEARAETSRERKKCTYGRFPRPLIPIIRRVSGGSLFTELVVTLSTRFCPRPNHQSQPPLSPKLLSSFFVSLMRCWYCTSCSISSEHSRIIVDVAHIVRGGYIFTQHIVSLVVSVEPKIKDPFCSAVRTTVLLCNNV